jgi:hypothetical protein
MWQQILESIRFGSNNKDCHLTVGKVLLVLKTPVNRQKNVILALLGERQKFTVLLAGKPCLLAPFRTDDVADSVSIFEECTRQGECSSELFDECGLRKLQSTDSRLARNGGKIVQKFIDGLATFEVAQEGLEGDACALKDRRTAEYLRILDDDIVGRIHNEYPIAYLSWCGLFNGSIQIPECHQASSPST